MYRVVWQPLLEGKFGPFASHVSAVWFWNKLKLRGGSRGLTRIAWRKGRPDLRAPCKSFDGRLEGAMRNSSMRLPITITPNLCFGAIAIVLP